MKSDKSLIFKIIKIVFSVILSSIILLSVFAAAIISEVRAYFSSDTFYERIENTDIKNAAFEINGETLTVSDYIYGRAEDSVLNKLPFEIPFVSYAIDAVLSLDTVDKTVKQEILSCVDYFLNSDSKAAGERLKKGISSQKNEKLNTAKAKSAVEYVRISVRAFVLADVEERTGVSCDRIIVLLSEETLKNLLVFAVIAAVLLTVINYRTIFSLFLYSGCGAIIYCILIKTLQGGYEKIAEGGERLIYFYLVTPLVESFSKSASAVAAAGAALLILYAVFIVFYRKFVKNKPDKNKITV